MLELNKIYNQDCLEGMQYIDDKSIDMILCDLPYGTTACKWDTIIPFELLWEQYERIIKDNGVIVLTATQPFTTDLINSNRKLFKYEWIWEKSFGSNFAHAPNMPLKVHENILVFSKGKIGHIKQLNNKRMIYNPQGITDGKRKSSSNNSKKESDHKIWRKSHNPEHQYKKENYPRSVLYFSNASNQDRGLHPTQKPIELFEYLIRTYSNEGDLVLDNCIGSGTTAIAALNTNRNYIGFEWSPSEPHDQYYNLAVKRIEEYENTLKA